VLSSTGMFTDTFITCRLKGDALEVAQYEHTKKEETRADQPSPITTIFIIVSLILGFCISKPNRECLTRGSELVSIERSGFRTFLLKRAWDCLQTFSQWIV